MLSWWRRSSRNLRIVENLEPGELLICSGPRRFIVGKKGLALVQVLAQEPHVDVIHVRIFATPDDENEVPWADIGHIPIARASLAPDVVKPDSRKPIPEECWASINGWRRRFSSGEVSAFGVPLWQAVQMAWEVANSAEHSTELRCIEYAFPKRAASGEMSVVEVSVSRLS